MAAIDTAVTAEPESCRDSAKQLRDIRKAADDVETTSKKTGTTFSGATASGQIAVGLSSACTILNGRGRALSDDLDKADQALVTFAISIDAVIKDMASARSHALDHRLVVENQTTITLPADPEPEQVTAYNECVAAVNTAREDEFRATRTLQQVMNTLAPHEEPLPAAPVDGKPVAVPAAPTGPSGPSSGPSSGGSDGGVGPTSSEPGPQSGPQISPQSGPQVGAEPVPQDTIVDVGAQPVGQFAFTPVDGVRGPHGEQVFSTGRPRRTRKGTSRVRRATSSWSGTSTRTATDPRAPAASPSTSCPSPGCTGHTASSSTCSPTTRGPPSRQPSRWRPPSRRPSSASHRSAPSRSRRRTTAARRVATAGSSTEVTTTAVPTRSRGHGSRSRSGSAGSEYPTDGALASGGHADLVRVAPTG